MVQTTGTCRSTAQVAPGDHGERAIFRIGIIEMNANRYQLLKDLLVRFPIGEVFPATSMPHGRAVRVQRDGDDNVLMTRRRPIRLGMLVEEECVDWESRSPKCAASEIVEHQLRQPELQRRPIREEPSSAVGLPRAVTNRPRGRFWPHQRP